MESDVPKLITRFLFSMTRRILCLLDRELWRENRF